MRLRIKGILLRMGNVLLVLTGISLHFIITHLFTINTPFLCSDLPLVGRYIFNFILILPFLYGILGLVLFGCYSIGDYIFDFSHLNDEYTDKKTINKANIRDKVITYDGINGRIEKEDWEQYMPEVESYLAENK